jgi:hypothetical protein
LTKGYSAVLIASSIAGATATTVLPYTFPKYCNHWANCDQAASSQAGNKYRELKPATEEGAFTQISGNIEKPS